MKTAQYWDPEFDRLYNVRKKDPAAAELWKKKTSHFECHYWGSASVYSLIGYGLAEGMKELVQP